MSTWVNPLSCHTCGQRWCNEPTHRTCVESGFVDNHSFVPKRLTQPGEFAIFEDHCKYCGRSEADLRRRL